MNRTQLGLEFFAFKVVISFIRVCIFHFLTRYLNCYLNSRVLTHNIFFRFGFALHYGAILYVRMNYPATAVSVHAWVGCEGVGWVIAVVMVVGGYVSVGIAGYRSLKVDPFTSSCTADRTDKRI